MVEDHQKGTKSEKITEIYTGARTWGKNVTATLAVTKTLKECTPPSSPIPWIIHRTMEEMGLGFYPDESIHLLGIPFP